VRNGGKSREICGRSMTASERRDPERWRGSGVRGRGITGVTWVLCLMQGHDQERP
jgi:hypothetical protein